MAQPTKSLSLNGSNQAYYTSDNTMFGGDFTLEWWYKFNTDPTSNQHYLLDKWIGSGNHRDWIMTFLSGDLFHIENTSDGSTSTRIIDNLGTTDLSSAVWYHFAFTYDVSTGEGKLWMAIEGGTHTLLDTTITMNTTIHDGTAVYYWFSENGTGFYANGIVHDKRVWSTVRTESELNDNFQNADLSDSATDLIRRWRFEDDLTDSTSSDNAIAIGTMTYSTDVPSWASPATDIKNSSLADNLISVYLSDAEGLTTDLHGTNTLTNNNGVTVGTSLGQGTTGQFVRASSQYLSSASSDFDVASTLSMYARIYMDSSAGNMSIASKHGGGSNRKFFWYIDSSGVVYFSWRNTSNTGGTTLSASTALSDATTYDVGVSFTSSAVTFYLDGASDGGGGGVTGLPTGGSANFEIGAQNGGNLYDGRIQQVLFSSAAEDASWFSGIFNGSDGLPYEDAGAPPETTKNTFFFGGGI